MIITSWVTRGLRPGDEVHIPRWLDELRRAEQVATDGRFRCQWCRVGRHGGGQPACDDCMAEKHRVMARLGRLPGSPNHARWLDG